MKVFKMIYKNDMDTLREHLREAYAKYKASLEAVWKSKIVSQEAVELLKEMEYCKGYFVSTLKMTKYSEEVAIGIANRIQEIYFSSENAIGEMLPYDFLIKNLEEEIMENVEFIFDNAGSMMMKVESYVHTYDNMLHAMEDLQDFVNGADILEWEGNEGIEVWEEALKYVDFQTSIRVDLLNIEEFKDWGENVSEVVKLLDEMY